MEWRSNGAGCALLPCTSTSAHFHTPYFLLIVPIAFRPHYSMPSILLRPRFIVQFHLFPPIFVLATTCWLACYSGWAERERSDDARDALNIITMTYKDTAKRTTDLPIHSAPCSCSTVPCSSPLIVWRTFRLSNVHRSCPFIHGITISYCKQRRRCGPKN